MPEARLAGDIGMGAKRYWLLEPLGGYSYILVVPKPTEEKTVVCAATDHGPVDALKDEKGDPILLMEFDEVLRAEDAIKKAGYTVTGGI